MDTDFQVQFSSSRSSEDLIASKIKNFILKSLLFAFNNGLGMGKGVNQFTALNAFNIKEIRIGFLN
jgi:hypothetical protein